MGHDGIAALPKIGAIKKIGQSRSIPNIDKEVDLPKPPYLNEETEQERLEKYAKQGVMGSLPERIVWKWLEDHRYVFDVQQSHAGGRYMRGGFVVDFIVYTLAAMPVAIRVMGEYYHGPMQPGTPGRDDAAAARLRRDGYIVCDLWEQDIYDAAPDLLRLIMRELRA